MKVPNLQSIFCKILVGISPIRQIGQIGGKISLKGIEREMIDYTQIKSINDVEQHTLRLQRKAGFQKDKIHKDINKIYLHIGQRIYKKIVEWLWLSDKEY